MGPRVEAIVLMVTVEKLGFGGQVAFVGLEQQVSDLVGEGEVLGRSLG